MSRSPRSIRFPKTPSLKLNPLAAALAAGLFTLPPLPAMAATINVNGTTCTLAEAIFSANNDSANEGGEGNGCADGSGADTLILQAGSTHTLTAVDNYSVPYFGDNGLPLITSNITIQGNGSTIVRAATAPAFRIFFVQGGNLSLLETTVTGGVTSDAHTGQNYTRTGAGLFVNGGTATLTDSTVSGNTAGIYGGGLSVVGGVLNLTRSTVSGNTSGYRGGGVFNQQGSITVTNSTVSGNRSFQRGGGLSNLFGTVTLTDSTVSGNTIELFGGGVENQGYTDVAQLRAITTLSRTLVSGNISVAGAAGAEVSNLNDTIIADDSNLFGHSGLSNGQAFASFIPGASDLTATSDGTVPTVLLDILDTRLDHNGGPTQTHALLLRSPAVDAAGLCDGIDQRGVGRAVGAACDIGAFEGTELRDFGDAPATYPVTQSADGARHVPRGPKLGSLIDVEADGQPSSDASGDDSTSGEHSSSLDDEDGVAFGTLVIGTGTNTLNLQVSGAAGKVSVWIDLNADGDWDDFGEQILDNFVAVVGSNPINGFFVANFDSVPGPTFARVRISSAGVSGPTGPAPDGEVEDLRVTLTSPPQPGSPGFSSATYSVGENGPTATITVNRVGGSSGVLRVNYATSNGTASAGSDYTPASGTLTWASGDTVAKTFTVPIIDDTIDEPNETVNLVLTAPPTNNVAAALAPVSQAVLTIIDNDEPSSAGPRVMFAATQSSPKKPESFGTDPIKVLLSRASTQTVTVPILFSGPATRGRDYTAPGSVTFQPGQTLVNLPIKIIDDRLKEPTENIVLSLGAPTHAGLGNPRKRTVTILDND